MHSNIEMKLTEKQLNNFHNKIRKTDNCWYWIGSMNTRGYGVVSLNYKPLIAHRVMYMIHNGNIPSSVLVRHSCHTKNCVNPAHLVPGSHRDNKDDCVNADRQAMGKTVSTAKLTEGQVLEIRRRRADGKTGTTLAKAYGVNHTCIYAIVNRKTWKHI